MFSRFEKEGILNPKIGRQYREAVISRGGSMSGEEMIRNFLGIEPSYDAFYKSLGIN